MHHLNVLLLIPCYNEEENIDNIIKQLLDVRDDLRNKPALIFNILIINDGSTDGTREKLQACCDEPAFDIIHFDENRGYGRVLITGFQFALENGYDWVISFDMDGQHEPKCLYRFLKAINDAPDQVHIISGSRYKDPEYFWQKPWKDRFLVNTIVTGILNARGFNLTDSFCGMKAHRVKEINQIGLETDGYQMPIEMLLKARNAGLGIEELPVPVIYKNRDEVLKKRKEDKLFVFESAEKRLGIYIDLISHYSGQPLKCTLGDYLEIFQSYFETIDEINAGNFKQVQESIFSEIKKRES